MTKPNDTLIEPNQEYWALVSSDPEVFTDMIKQYGVKNTKVEELLAIDFANLQDNGPVHGLVFTSEYIEEPLPKEWENEDIDENNIIFTSQVVTNACATLALLNVLLNSEVEEKGDLLDNFIKFTKGFSSVNRGLCLGNSKELRNIHNAYLPATQRLEKLVTNQTATGNEENESTFTGEFETSYHYIAYIYKNGFIWELDGLKKRPHKLLACDKNNWLTASESIIQTRIQNLQKHNEVLSFNLLAVCHDNSGKIATDNAILRQKFDYFPFIEAVVKKALKRSLLEEPEVAPVVEEKNTKKRKKVAEPKPAAKRRGHKKKEPLV